MNFGRWLYRKSKTEVKIVIATLVVLISLPTITLVVAASSGVALVGQALAAVNPVTHLVEIFDPDGNKIQELQLSTTWPAMGYVTDEFGTRSAERKEMGLGPHTGIDIANERNETGSPIYPFMDGVILFVNEEDDNSCGKYVRIEHGNGITSLYCHMISIAITKDAIVKPGDTIGYMGSTGTSTGAHVHFQIMVYEIPVNPRTFMVGEPTGTYYNVQPTY